jgi:hypothetical protein
MMEEVMNLSGASFLRALISVRRAHLHDLITSHRPHLTVPFLGLGILTFEWGGANI